MTAATPRLWNALAQLAAIAPVSAVLTMPAARGSRRRSAFIGSDANATRGAFAWLRPIRLRCLFVGHHDYLSREPHRLLLRCGECGRRTRGWAIATNPPRVTAAPRSHVPAIAAQHAIG